MSLEVLRRVLGEEAEAIRRLADRLGSEFVQAVDWITVSMGRVVPCGVGKSGHVGRKAAATFASTGTPSLFLHAAEALHGDLGMVTAADVVLVYTYSGETDEIVRLFPSFQAIGARTIALTGRIESSAARLADLVLDVAVEREACPNNLAPTTSTTVMMAISDALAVAVMERRGFKSEDFAKFHPSGALGRRLLLTVRDVMRTGTDMALVSPNAPVLEVMRAITNAGAGAACVVEEGRLVGFVSDGDLRRHMLAGEGSLAAVASDLMVTGVTTIAPDLLAAEAVEVFQNLPKKIGEMPVVEDGRVVGMLMLKDLLRSGIL
ncbi:MAG TPA: KpsF/GutQ family sugar-phosphate isomerase [Fimbriimonadaceae bacterium]|nr:KpsF/GutQ family sugar-phosphate isomerase [Fimbriimonadaceae bacterium]HRJ96545.1 KpsF/GutQ family sugar-phosphate isomerase [Fimbriimonadaceae bacterium]